MALFFNKQLLSSKDVLEQFETHFCSSSISKGKSSVHNISQDNSSFLTLVSLGHWLQHFFLNSY